MKTTSAWQDGLRLAFSKKELGHKLAYLLKALVFVPFLSRGSAGAKGRGATESMSQTGDDIYPLF